MLQIVLDGMNVQFDIINEIGISYSCHFIDVSMLLVRFLAKPVISINGNAKEMKRNLCRLNHVAARYRPIYQEVLRMSLLMLTVFLGWIW